MAPCRLLVVNHAVEIGGAERVLLRFLAHLDRGSFEPSLACPRRGPLVEEAEGMGFRVHLGFPSRRLLQVKRRSLGEKRWAVLAYPWDFTRTVVGLSSLIRKEGYDLVLTNSAKADIYGSLAGWLARRPVVWRLHDIVDERAFSRLNLLLFRIFASLFAARVLAVSEASRRALVSLGVAEEKVVTVHNGVEEARVPRARREGAREEWGIPADAPLVGMVGRLVDWKGPDVFLKAAAEVSRRLPEARFMLVGDAVFGERAYLEELRETARGLGLAEKAVFTGFREDVLEIMSSFDVLVHASILPDPLPTVLLEAMSLGLPVVAADGGGVREIVEEGVTGLVVPPGDAAAMARAVSWALSHAREAREMGEAGRRRARERFDLAAKCREMEDELAAVLERRGSRGA
ncbi:MAG: glycosyltransferase [Actinobacteria bacterium]|nr:glycosyltransferase [Actinomycetota bacterium]